MRTKQPRRVTSYCVAKEAGVSQSAVSRAYNPGASISKKTLKKIQAAATKLGYKPNAIARSLISRRSNMIGIVMADIINPFYPAVLDLFMRRLQARGHKGMLFMASRDEEVDDFLEQLMNYQVDGVIITSATLSSEMASRCIAMGTPVTLFNRYVMDNTANSVCCDNAGAARMVADHFASLGATRMAFMAGVENTSTSRDRELGFTTRIKQLGLPAPLRCVGNYTYQGGYQAALSLLTQAQKPDAMFCANDLMALGALDAMRIELGMHAPRDLAIVGFDDIVNSSWPGYNLSTVRVPVEIMVERAIESLLERVENPDAVPLKTSLACELVVRGTSQQGG